MAATTTRKGKEILSGRLIGASPTQAEPKVLNWGYNPSALTAAATDVALFQEGAETRVTGSSSQVTTTTTNDTYQITATQTATGTRAVGEVALFDSTTQPGTATVAAGAGVIGSTSSTALTTNATFSPGNNNYIQIRTEVMQVTAGSGTTSLTVVRAQNGSSAISTIASNDPVGAGNPPGQTGVTGGSMLLHADHTVDNLNTNDSVAYTIKLQFT